MTKQQDAMATENNSQQERSGRQDKADRGEVARLHERIDDLVEAVSGLAQEVRGMAERCKPCRDLVDAHQRTLHGNGKAGVVERLAAAETGRVDTLSVKSVAILLGAVGTLATTLGGAITAIVAAMLK